MSSFESLVRTQALNYSLVMNGVILGDNDDSDHVPELGVEFVDVQPLQDEIKCRTHVHKVDCKTFTTQTFTTPDVHHPQCKIRHSPPQMFTIPSVKSDVHHPRRSPPQTFTTPSVKSRDGKTCRRCRRVCAIFSPWLC